MISFQLTGVNETLAFLKSTGTKIGQKTEEGLKIVGQFITDEVKASIDGQRAEPRSVNTGNFLNSINFIALPDNVIIFTDVDYSVYLEYGTSRINPRRHFGNTVSRENFQAAALLKTSILG